jgi:hypothetical protein
VGRAQINPLQQLDVNVRLVLPDVERHSLQPPGFDGGHEGGGINHGATRRIDQDRPRLERGEERLVGQVKSPVDSLMGQGRVKRNEIAVIQCLNRYVFRVAGLALERRIVAEDLHAQPFALGGHAPADVADPDDADGLAFEPNAVPPAQLQQSRNDVLSRGVGVGARGGGKPDAAAFEIAEVNMIKADGGRTHKTHRTARKQLLVDRRNAADQQRIGVRDRLGRHVTAAHEFDLTR